MKNLIASSDIEKELLKNLNTIFADSDYEILRIRINENKIKNIQIMIDHKRKNIDINDCANYSRKISNYLENNNLILDEFDLEISSPGLDRPLTRLKDFQKYIQLQYLQPVKFLQNPFYLSAYIFQVILQ